MARIIGGAHFFSDGYVISSYPACYFFTFEFRDVARESREVAAL